MDNNPISKNTPIFDIEIPGFQILCFRRIYGSEDVSVKVRFENPRMGLDKSVTLSMREVNSTREFRKKIPQSFSIPDVTPSHQVEMLCYAIKQALNRPEMRIEEALPQGFSLVNNHLFYVIGDSILPTKKYDKKQFKNLIAENPYQIRLYTEHSDDKKATAENMFDWVNTFCRQGHPHAVLFLCAMTPYMKYVLPDSALLGNIVSGYLLGESGVGKTELIKLMTGITTGECGVNLESDMENILSFLGRSPDRAVLIDDLNLTASASQKAKK